MDASAAPVLDARGDTLDHVVRAVAHTGFLPQALQLMLASPEHRHDPELLYRTRGVRGAGGRTLLMRAVQRCIGKARRQKPTRRARALVTLAPLISTRCRATRERGAAGGCEVRGGGRRP